MNIVLAYKDYLFSQKNKPSKVTIKNYVSDVRKFILWYEGFTSQPFAPDAINPETVKAFHEDFLNTKQGALPAARSAKRYISSLRSFSRFLEHSGAIKANPFEVPVPVKVDDDPWKLKSFSNQLVNDKASKLTVKNYIIDIKQFLLWLEQVANTNEPETSRFTHIDNYAVEQYKARLLNEMRFSPVSINRKLSSLRRYLRWLNANKYINTPPTIDDITSKQTSAAVAEATAPNDIPPVDLPLTALKELENEYQAQNPHNYSQFAPFRLGQKVGKLITLGFDSLIINPIISSNEAVHYFLWKRSGKKIFAPIKTILEKSAQAGITAATIPAREKLATLSLTGKAAGISANAASFIGRLSGAKASSKPYTIHNISKEFYAPLKISLKDMPWDKRLMHHLKYTRPVWYKRYHTYPIVHNFHFAILFAATTLAMMSTFYVAVDSKPINSPVFASSQSSPPRTIAFQGRLLDKTNTPITADTNLRFGIYNSPTASNAAMLWQEVQSVQPDDEGNFTVTLGKVSTLNQQLFSNNQSLFVGISVGNDKELAPRQQLPTVSYAGNAQSLQGLKTITKSDKTANVILALDSSGNLTIGGSASPKFQATGGQFSLSGQSILLTTNPDSNGNIELAPDGSGIIDAQKPIQNTSNYISGAGVPGAVGVDDLLAVSATSSTHSALTVRQNSTGDIISGYNDITAKFRVKATGDTMIGGNLEMDGNTITTSNTSFALLNSNVTSLSIGNSATVLSLGAATGTTVINNSLSVKGTLQANGNIQANQGITIASGKALTLTDFTPGAIPFINSSNQLTHDMAKISWSQTNSALNVTGSLCLRSTAGQCSGTTAGTIYASNATVQAADLAENYLSANPLEPGDIVMPEGNGNSLAVKKTNQDYQNQVIGIISTNPGFTLNSDAQPDHTHPYLYPLALQGRVPVKVSAINGDIKAGDPLTTSRVPGVAMKATKPGQIIAKALEDYASSDKNAVSKIMVFVNMTYNHSPSYLTDSGDLSLADEIPQTDSKTIKRDNISTFGKPLGTTMNILLDMQTGFLAAKDITTQSLTVVSDNISVNGQHFNEYISGAVTTALKPYIASLQSAKNAAPKDNAAEPVNPDLNLALATASNSATTSDIKMNEKAATGSASNSPLYNSIATGSAQTPVLIEPTPEVTTTQTQPSIIPSASPLFKSDFATPASSPAELGLEKLDTKDASVTNSFSVLGRTTLTDVGITGSVNIGLMSIDGLRTNSSGSSFASINTSAGPLKFQSDGFNGVDFLNGKITISTTGDLNVSGNAYFARNVTVKGTLEAGTIAPVPGSDLVVKLDKNSRNSALNVKDTQGSNVVSVSSDGDINASGSGKFMNLNIIRGAQADTSSIQTNAAGSAGKGTIKTNQKERTIVTPFVSAQSLIYVTATSDTQKMNLYVARQTAEEPASGVKGSFTIQVPTLAKKDISFNWWIVN